jgi:hypothetical protein
MKVLSIPRNGGRAPVDQRRSATPAVSDGPKKRRKEQGHPNRWLCNWGRALEAVRVHKCHMAYPVIWHLGKVQVGSLFNGVQEGHEQ